MNSFRYGDYIKTRCETHLIDFARFFNVQTIKKKYMVAKPHLEIAEALDRVVNMQCKRLIINIAPRFGKTQLAVKYFIAYGFTRNPASQFIHLSYSDELVNKNSREIKEIMTTDAYRFLFPQVELKRVRSGGIETKSGGCLYCASTGGQVTGFGAGINSPDGEKVFGGAIIIDDPIKPDDALSNTQREKVNDRFESVIRNRVNSKDTPIIIIMQRVHDHDLCGYLIEREGEKKDGGEWEVLTLPAIYYDEQGKQCSLWEHKYSVEELLRLRKINPWVFDTQYMQDPSPIEGLLFNRDETKYFDYIPDEPDLVFMQLDPADEGNNCFCSKTYYIKEGYCLNVDTIYTEDKLEIALPRIKEQILRWKPSHVNIESNSAWRLVAKDIKEWAAENAPDSEIHRYNATTNKEIRIFNEAPTIRNRFLYLAPSLQNDEYRKSMEDKHKYLKMIKDQKDDGVDCDAAASHWAKRNGLISVV